MPSIHKMSIVEDGAKLADDVVIGPFCVVGPEVEIGPGTVLESHVTISGRTRIGARNRFSQGCSIGCRPQDKKYADEPTQLVIGDDNYFRENCTVAIGTVQDEGITRVGSRNLFMAYSHVAHDCVVGDDIVVANCVPLAGHVHVQNGAIVGGLAAVHQFSRIGQYAMIGGLTPVDRDVPPFVLVNNNPAKPRGLNVVGLRRLGVSAACLRVMKDAYRAIYEEGLLVAESVAKIEVLAQTLEDPKEKEMVLSMARFLSESRRGIIR